MYFVQTCCLDTQSRSPIILALHSNFDPRPIKLSNMWWWYSVPHRNWNERWNIHWISSRDSAPL